MRDYKIKGKTICTECLYNGSCNMIVKDLKWDENLNLIECDHFERGEALILKSIKKYLQITVFSILIIIIILEIIFK